MLIGPTGTLDIALLLQHVTQHQPSVIALRIQSQRQTQISQANLALFGADQGRCGAQQGKGGTFLDGGRGGGGLAGCSASARRLQTRVRPAPRQGRIVKRNGLGSTSPPLQKPAIAGDGNLGPAVAAIDGLEVGLGLVKAPCAFIKVGLADLSEVVDAGIATNCRSDQGCVQIAHGCGSPRRQQRRGTPMRKADAVGSQHLPCHLALVDCQRLNRPCQATYPLALV